MSSFFGPFVGIEYNTPFHVKSGNGYKCVFTDSFLCKVQDRDRTEDEEKPTGKEKDMPWKFMHTLF